MLTEMNHLKTIIIIIYEINFVHRYFFEEQYWYNNFFRILETIFEIYIIGYYS